MKFNFKYKGKDFEIDVEKCSNFISQIRGLMFRKKSKPLLFIFNKPVRIRIHSFFCKPFAGVWFMKNKIVDVKIVKPWIFSIRAKEKFDKLLEIPASDKSFSWFIDDYRNI